MDLRETHKVNFTINGPHLIMWEALALISHKAAKERHWDEAEEDDEEDRPTDDSLGLWAAQTDDQEEKKHQSRKSVLLSDWTFIT